MNSGGSDVIISFRWSHSLPFNFNNLARTFSNIHWLRGVDEHSLPCNSLIWFTLLPAVTSGGHCWWSQLLPSVVRYYLIDITSSSYFRWSLPVVRFTSFPVELIWFNSLVGGESSMRYSSPRGKTDKLEEPVNRELNVTKSWNLIHIVNLAWFISWMSFKLICIFYNFKALLLGNR